MPLTYPYDPTGVAASNLISNEEHVITDQQSRFFVPDGGPFFTRGMQLRSSANVLLQPGVDYQALHLYKDAALATGKEVCAVVRILNPAISGTVRLTYQVVGGDFSATVDALRQLLADADLDNGQTFAWSSIIGAPVQYPPTSHLHHSSNIFGMSETVTVLEGIRTAILAGDGAVFQMVYQYIDTLMQNLYAGTISPTELDDAVQAAVASHKSEVNAHTKGQVGLSLVQNFGLATTAEAQQGSVNNKYMTPALTTALVTALVNRAWLGLDKVPNFPLANDTQKLDQSNDVTLMSPKRVADLINNMRPNSSLPVFASDAEGLMGAEAGKMASPKTARESAKGLFGKLTTQTFTSFNPNTVLEPVMLAQHANCPRADYPYLILTFFNRTADQAIAATTPRAQVAFIADNGATLSGTPVGFNMAKRYFNGTAWSAWTACLDKNDVGLDKLSNFALATEAEAWAGAVDRYVTAERAAQAARGVMRQVGAFNLKDPNAALEPVFISQHNNCPSPTESYFIQNVFQVALATDVPTTNTDRTQYAFGRNTTGIWKRDLSGGVWSSWTDATYDPVNLSWANAGLYIFDHKLYDTAAAPTAVSTYKGWRTAAMSLSSPDNVCFVRTRDDNHNRFDAIAGGNKADSSQLLYVGTNVIGSNYAPVTKIETIFRDLNKNMGHFYLRRVDDTTLASMNNAQVSSQLCYTNLSSYNTLIQTNPGTNRLCAIDLLKLQSGNMVLVAREANTGRFGIMFSRYGEADNSSTADWGFGIPTTDTTPPSVQTQLAILAEGTVTARGTWHGAGNTTITFTDINNFMKFSTANFGKWIGAHAIGDRVFLVFNNNIVVVDATVNAAGEITSTGINFASGAPGSVYGGLYDTSTKRFSTFSYLRNNSDSRIIGVDEEGVGWDQSFDYGSAFGVIGLRRSFVLRTDNLGIGTVANRKILGVGYSGGLLWAAVGSFDPVTNSSTILQLAAAPWDPVKSRATTLQLKTVFKYTGSVKHYPTTQRTPIVVSDTSDLRLHLVGAASTDFVLCGKNTHRNAGYYGEASA